MNLQKRTRVLINFLMFMIGFVIMSIVVANAAIPTTMRFSWGYDKAAQEISTTVQETINQ